jgi:hypothetical protein
MEMEVRNFLSGRRAIGEQDVDPFAFDSRCANCSRNSLADDKKMGNGCLVELMQKARRLERDDKDMPSVYRLDVHDGQHHLIAIHHGRWQTPRNDFREYIP